MKIYLCLLLWGVHFSATSTVLSKLFQAQEHSAAQSGMRGSKETVYFSGVDAYQANLDGMMLSIPSEPRSADIRHLMTPVKHQHQREACSMFAAVAFNEFYVKNWYKAEDPILSEQAYLALEPKDPGALEDRLLSTAKQLIWDTPLLPYEGDDTDSPSYRSQQTRAIATNLPALDWGEAIPFSYDVYGCRLREQGKGNGKRIGRVAFQSNITWLAVKQQLARGEPVALSLFTYRDYGWCVSGNIECLPTWALSQCDSGLHAIVLVGYDDARQVFFFKNSWGTTWGRDHGYGTITYKALAASYISGSASGAHAPLRLLGRAFTDQRLY